jgi:type VI secretion system (T6SS) effector Hcp
MSRLRVAHRSLPRLRSTAAVRRCVARDKQTLIDQFELQRLVSVKFLLPDHIFPGTVEIRWYRIDDAGKEKEYFNTRLVAVKPKMHDIKNPDYEYHNHLEDVELRYETITWSYKDGNIIHRDTWNERS